MKYESGWMTGTKRNNPDGMHFSDATITVSEEVRANILHNIVNVAMNYATK